MRAEGKGLRIWPPAQVAGMVVDGTLPPAKPLIDLTEFSFRAPLHYSSGKPIRISQITLRGLTIDIPPKPHLYPTAPAQPPKRRSKPGRSTVSAGSISEVQRSCAAQHRPVAFRGGQVLLHGSPRDARKQKPCQRAPRLRHPKIKVTHIDAQTAPWTYEATLTNPRPRDS